jgi:hypothetical protein
MTDSPEDYLLLAEEDPFPVLTSEATAAYEARATTKAIGLRQQIKYLEEQRAANWGSQDRREHALAKLSAREKKKARRGLDQLTGEVSREKREKRQARAARRQERAARRQHLTPELLATAEPNGDDRRIPLLPEGLELRIRASGHKSYLFRYKSVVKRLGDVESTPVAAAVTAAEFWRRHVDSHRLPPPGSRDHPPEIPHYADMTMDELFERFSTDMLDFSSKWARDRRRCYERFVRPRLGKRHVADITTSDLQDCIDAAPGYDTQRHTRSLLCGLYDFAKTFGLGLLNPARATVIRDEPRRRPAPQTGLRYVDGKMRLIDPEGQYVIEFKDEVEL